MSEIPKANIRIIEENNPSHLQKASEVTLLDSSQMTDMDEEKVHSSAPNGPGTPKVAATYTIMSRWVGSVGNMGMEAPAVGFGVATVGLGVAAVGDGVETVGFGVITTAVGSGVATTTVGDGVAAVGAGVEMVGAGVATVGFGVGALVGNLVGAALVGTSTGAKLGLLDPVTDGRGEGGGVSPTTGA